MAGRTTGCKTGLRVLWLVATPLLPHSVNDTVQRLVVDAGVPDTRFHDMRKRAPHCFCWQRRTQGLSKTYLVTEADYTCTCSTQPRSTLGGECRCRRRQRICRDFVAVSADTVAG